MALALSVAMNFARLERCPKM